MELAAFVLLLCVQEPQRSGKERDEPVRAGVPSSPLTDDGARVRGEREREEDRRPRDSRDGAPRPGPAHPPRPWPGISGVSVDFAPDLGDRFHSGGNPRVPDSPPAELYFDLGPSTPDGGLGIFTSRSRLPLPDLDPAGAEEFWGLDDRYGIDGWLALGSSLELYGRAEQWSDHEDSGATLRARATWRDAFGPGDPFLLETYVGSGRSVHATGVRASGRKHFAFGGVGLSWEATDLDDEGIDEKLLQHAVRADIDFALGKHWALGVYAQSQFGDDEDTLSLGFALQLGID